MDNLTQGDRTLTTETDNHGTHAGYQRHANHGQIPCEPCAVAEKAYHKERNTSVAEIRRQKKEDRLIAQMYVMERLTIARNKERERYATRVLESQ